VGRVQRLSHGHYGENLAEKYAIDRARQDAFAPPHSKAAAAREAGRFNAEITPSAFRAAKEPLVVSQDEPPRPETSLELLNRLRPAFRPDGGTVTAGNASSLNDGAAAVLVMSGESPRA
jgi:acetyl-CoA C-acetyltransferase